MNGVRGDVQQGVGIDQHQIGIGADLDATFAVGEAEDLRGAPGQERRDLRIADDAARREFERGGGERVQSRRPARGRPRIGRVLLGDRMRSMIGADEVDRAGGRGLLGGGNVGGGAQGRQHLRIGTEARERAGVEVQVMRGDLCPDCVFWRPGLGGRDDLETLRGGYLSDDDSGIGGAARLDELHEAKRFAFGRPAFGKGREIRAAGRA